MPKLYRAFAFVGFILFAAFAASPKRGLATGCTPAQRQAIRTVLDIADSTCIVAKQALPEDKIMQACHLVEKKRGPMRELLTATRQQVSLARDEGARVGCAPRPDGGQ